MPDPSYKDPLLDLLAVDNGDEDNEENDYDILDFLTGEKDTDPLLDPDPDPNKKYLSLHIPYNLILAQVVVVTTHLTIILEKIEA